MPDIKINNPGVNVQSLNQDSQIDKQLTNRGNFQGQSVNSVTPPPESPLSDTTQNKTLTAALAQPPSESPIFGKTGQTKGYSFSSNSTNNNLKAPSNEALFDFATGKTNSNISKYLDQDPAASKAVNLIRQGNKEIGSPDNLPKLDPSVQTKLEQLTSKIFRR